MKKLFLLLSTSLACAVVFAQETPKLENDTLYYANQKYYVGEEIKLSYGSSSTKAFAFVQIGTALSGLTPLEASRAKSAIKIDKIYKQAGKYYIRGKLIDAGAMMGNKIFIDVEGAVDNKEIKLDE